MRMTTRGAILKPTNTVVRVNGTQKFTVSGTSATVDIAWTETGHISVDNTTSNSVTITGRVEGNDVLVVTLSDGTQLTSTVLISNTAEIPPTEPEPEPIPPSPTTIPVTGITADEWDVRLEVGQTKKVNASVVPEDATNKSLHWWVEYPWVATVDSNGTITATGVGYTPATVTTDEGNYVWTIHVNVSEATTPVPPVPPQPTYGNIVVSKTSINIQEGQSETITIKLDKEPTNQQYLTISKDNNNIMIDKDGLSFDSSNWNVGQIVNVLGVMDLTNHSDRTSKITISSDNVESKAIDVVVKSSYIAVSSVVLNFTSTSMYVGDSTTLTATVTPNNATNKSIRWASDSDCVTIDQNGNIIAVKKGTATITATSVDNNKSARCIVDILEKVIEPNNNPPTISPILVISEESDGTYIIQWNSYDSDGDILSHKLKLDDSDFIDINPLKDGSRYTYHGTGLSSGIHMGKIRVFDGKIYTESNVFSINISEKNEVVGVKGMLKEAKDEYDKRHMDLINTINFIVEDGIFDKEHEQQQLDDAFNAYNKALFDLKKMFQKATDYITDAKKEEAVEESGQKINNAISGLQDKNDEIMNRIDEAFSDEVISSHEKVLLQSDLRTIDSQYDSMKAMVTEFNDSAVTGQFNTLTSRHRDLHDLLDPLLVDLNTATEVSNATIRESLYQYQLQYNITFVALQTLLDSRLNTLTTTVNTTAQGIETAITKSNSALNGVETIGKHFNFTDSGWVEIFSSINGKPGRFKAQITDQRFSFLDNNSEVAYLSNRNLYITEAQILNALQIGNVSLSKTAKGGLIFQWKG